MTDRFARALPLVLAHEGGWADHPRDPGGATMKGVTLATFRRYVPNATKDKLRNISDEMLARIYREGYWDIVKGDELPPGLDYALFDWAVNSGPRRAATGAALDLTGVEARLAVAWPGHSALFVSGRDAEVTILPQTGDTMGWIEVRFGLPFTRALPAGAVAQYELELRGLLLAGVETNGLFGPLIVQGGLNPDGVIA